MTHPLDVTTQIAATCPTGDSMVGWQPKARVSNPGALAHRAGRALNAAATSWFVVTVLGQLMFTVFIVGFYGRAAQRGQFEAWNKVLPHGWVSGDTWGNLVLSLHLSFAALITLGGALQLISGVRRLFPTFHRWNGRVYLVSCLVMSVGGLTMVWTHGTVGDLSQHIAISINALLIMLCASMALRHALGRRFDMHRRWALRLFLVVSGVWFFRIGLMFWIVVNQGPTGFDPHTFTGPFLTFLSFAQYLLPLTMLQLHFFVQDRAGTVGRIALTTGLAAATLMMAAGIVAATRIMWLPHL